MKGVVRIFEKMIGRQIYRSRDNEIPDSLVSYQLKIYWNEGGLKGLEKRAQEEGFEIYPQTREIILKRQSNIVMYQGFDYLEDMTDEKGIEIHPSLIKRRPDFIQYQLDIFWKEGGYKSLEKRALEEDFIIHPSIDKIIYKRQKEMIKLQGVNYLMNKAKRKGFDFHPQIKKIMQRRK